MTQAGAEPGPGPEPEPDPNPGPDPEPDPALSRGPPAAGHRAMGHLAVYGYTYYGSGPWAVELTMAMLTMAILTMAAGRGRSSSTSCNRSTRDAPRRSTCRGMGQVRPLAVAELRPCASLARARRLSVAAPLPGREAGPLVAPPQPRVLEPAACKVDPVAFWPSRRRACRASRNRACRRACGRRAGPVTWRRRLRRWPTIPLAPPARMAGTASCERGSG